jgi:hypothetical protein
MKRLNLELLVPDDVSVQNIADLLFAGTKQIALPAKDPNFRILLDIEFVSDGKTAVISKRSVAIPKDMTKSNPEMELVKREADKDSKASDEEE